MNEKIKLRRKSVFSQDQEIDLRKYMLKLANLYYGITSEKSDKLLLTLPFLIILNTTLVWKQKCTEKNGCMGPKSKRKFIL